MKSHDLKDVGHFLRMHPEKVLRMAKDGGIPCAKIRRAWVLIDLDLADLLRSFYFCLLTSVASKVAPVFKTAV